jgi:hypothetical protein
VRRRYVRRAIATSECGRVAPFWLRLGSHALCGRDSSRALDAVDLQSRVRRVLAEQASPLVLKPAYLALSGAPDIGMLGPGRARIRSGVDPPAAFPLSECLRIRPDALATQRSSSRFRGARARPPAEPPPCTSNSRSSVLASLRRNFARQLGVNASGSRLRAVICERLR